MTWLDTQPPAAVDTALETLTRADDPAAERLFAYAADDMRFALWLALTNRRIVRACGFGLLDLPDWSWRDAYDDGSSPRAAAAGFLTDLDMAGQW
jgi:hypothetical protein